MSESTEIERLRTALKNLVVGIDRACISGETLEECLPETMQDPYEAARALLGDPVVMYPGGGVDAHYHYLGETAQGCWICEQRMEDEAREALVGCPKDDTTLDALIETIRTS